MGIVRQSGKVECGCFVAVLGHTAPIHHCAECRRESFSAASRIMPSSTIA
jgi:hypothetical protein